MYGRVIKRNNFYFCVIGSKTYPIEFDKNYKITNGDFVFVNSKKITDTGKIKRSDFEVLKKVSSEVKLIDIDNETPLFNRLENRILDLRRPINHAIFAIRSEINKTLAGLFCDSGYMNVNTPLIVGSQVEGRVKTFDVDFFGREASLTMTKLVHLRYLTCADFEKVYDLSPVFVGGKHKTSGHVSEYYTFDWASSEKTGFVEQLQYVDRVLFELVSRLLKFKDLLNEIKPDLNFEILLSDIKGVKKITYNEILVQYLAKNSKDTEVLGQYHLPERVISFAHSTYGNYLWVTEFPETFKQFYCDTTEVEGKNVVMSSELWWKGIKVASVSFSGSDHQKTLSRIKMLGLNPKSFKTYLNSIQLASAEAYLGSLYIERLMMTILDLDNMKESLMFPRATQGTVLDP